MKSLIPASILSKQIKPRLFSSSRQQTASEKQREVCHTESWANSRVCVLYGMWIKRRWCPAHYCISHLTVKWTPPRMQIFAASLPSSVGWISCASHLPHVACRACDPQMQFCQSRKHALAEKHHAKDECVSGGNKLTFETLKDWQLQTRSRVGGIDLGARQQGVRIARAILAVKAVTLDSNNSSPPAANAMRSGRRRQIYSRCAGKAASARALRLFHAATKSHTCAAHNLFMRHQRHPRVVREKGRRTPTGAADKIWLRWPNKSPDCGLYNCCFFYSGTAEFWMIWGGI